MSNQANHWAKSLPYLVPNWCLLSDDERTPAANNFIETTHELDVGGMGVFDGQAHKEVRKCHYVTNNSSLPFYVNAHKQVDPKPFINTLCLSSTNRLFAYNSQTIRSFQLTLDRTRVGDSSDFSLNMKVPHQYSSNKFSETSPFLWQSSGFVEQQPGGDRAGKYF